MHLACPVTIAVEKNHFFFAEIISSLEYMQLVLLTLARSNELQLYLQAIHFLKCI